MQYYNLDNYFQSAYLSGGDVIFAAPYMAFQKPLLVTILKVVTQEVLNQSITTDVNINTIIINMQIKKEKGKADWLYALYPFLNRMCSNNISYKMYSIVSK